jgi:spore maturation protein CgeB
MRYHALRRHNVEVKTLDARAILDSQSWFERHVASRVRSGLAVRKLNDRLVRAARDMRPDIVWLDKQELIEPEALEDVKRTGARLVYYTPDPYFAVAWKQTRLTRASMPLFDVFVTAKSYEIEDYGRFNGQVIYMPLGYCDEVHRPISGVSQEEMIDVSFVGGWEPRREKIMEALAARSHAVYIWGYGWDHLIDGRWTVRRRLRLKRLTPEGRPHIRKSERLASRIYPGEVYDDAYSRALTQSAISLGLLRTICPDQHTTRTFEIPACGSMLLADRTEEHQAFFHEGKEADFFSSMDELLDKADFYVRHPSTRSAIARAGQERCQCSGYSYFERFKPVLAALAHPSVH